MKIRRSANPVAAVLRIALVGMTAAWLWPATVPAQEGGPEEWYQEGRELFEAGDIKAAHANFAQLFRWKDENGQRHPLAPAAVFYIGRVNEAEDNNARAARYYVAVTRVTEAANSDIALQSAERLLGLGEREKAIKVFEWARDNAKQDRVRAQATKTLEALEGGASVEDAIAAGKASEAEAPAAVEPAPVEPAPVEPAPLTSAPETAPAFEQPAASVETQPAEITPTESAETTERALELMSTEQGETHVLRCYKTAETMSVDGLLAESAWRGAQEIVLDVYPWHNPLHGPRQKTVVKALYDENYLYFGIMARDMDILAKATGRDSKDLMADERVEVYLQVDRSSEEYMCFEVNAKGALLDYKARVPRQFNTKWNAQGTFVATQTVGGQKNRSYIVELAIPLIALAGSEGRLPAPGESWGVGFYRIDVNPTTPGGGRNLYAMWKSSGTRRPDFHQLSSMGVLQFQGLMVAGK